MHMAESMNVGQPAGYRERDLQEVLLVIYWYRVD